MATYKDIQNKVKELYGFVPKTCWIAHVKEINGLNPRKSANRLQRNKRANPCPDSKTKFIRKVLKYYQLI